MDTRRRVVVKQHVVHGHDPAAYVASRIFATAADGAQVPISLVHRRDLDRSAPRPLLLDGYGAYGVSADAGFSAAALSLLDRGFILATAQVRGGSELGRRWYEQGKMLHKRATFTDFIACAERLIAAGYTSPDALAITGGSAGGLLMGAVANMRPDLFHVIVADVPFVDVINTMLDPSLPLTVNEWEEWGNPTDRRYYEYMKSYSPYDNVAARSYPHMLITGGLHDPRVGCWEPAKWAAKLRAHKTDDNTLLLKTRMSGHGGASGRYEQYREAAFQYAFILKYLGLTNGTGRPGPASAPP